MTNTPKLSAPIPPASIPQAENALVMVRHVRTILDEIVSTALNAPRSPDMTKVEAFAACAGAALYDAETELDELAL